MKSFAKKPFFLLLFPLFFVFHGFTRYYNLIPAGSAFLLFLIYSVAGIFLAGVCWLLVRNNLKAAILASWVLFFQFFFGSIQDLVRKFLPGSLFQRYSFLISLFLLAFVAITILLRRTRKPLYRVALYLNVLFIILISIDAVSLMSRAFARHTKSNSISDSSLAIHCDSCSKPDIYFVILDEYAGDSALKTQFKFDNGPFEKELRDRGFHVTSHSNSNYNFTPFSVASTLNMEYLQLNMKTKGPGNLGYAYKLIRNSNAISALKNIGYDIRNYSIFDLAGEPAISYDHFLPTQTRLITAETFLSRLGKDVRNNVITGKWNWNSLKRKFIYSHLHNNENFLRLTREAALEKNNSPKFVYTHLMMPHDPFYFDRDGHPLPLEKLKEAGEKDISAYTGYLEYCNRIILGLVDDILKSSSQPPVIILVGDHGFRHIQNASEKAFCFMNLQAIFLPGGDYSQFYDGMSNVNSLRLMFNAQFHQQIPMLRDSTIYLW